MGFGKYLQRHWPPSYSSKRAAGFPDCVCRAKLYDQPLALPLDAGSSAAMARDVRFVQQVEINYDREQIRREQDLYLETRQRMRKGKTGSIVSSFLKAVHDSLNSQHNSVLSGNFVPAGVRCCCSRLAPGHDCHMGSSSLPCVHHHHHHHHHCYGLISMAADCFGDLETLPYCRIGDPVCYF